MENTTKNSTPFPTFIDLAGFENENSATTREMLRVIIFGRLHSGESLQSLRNFVATHSLVEVREKYNLRKEENKVDAIIFIASARESATLPVKLIEAVYDATYNSEYGENIFNVV